MVISVYLYLEFNLIAAFEYVLVLCTFGGILQIFDMEKFFDKESLVDTMYTLKTKAHIDDKDYQIVV